MNNLIAHLFLARELTHRAHLAATGDGSFASHMALGEFYPAIGDLADTLTETWQGYTGELLTIPMLYGDVTAPILDVLKAHRDWIGLQRYVAAPPDNSMIQNIIDEIVQQYSHTIYKLTFLK
jgi:hypothetical protein